MQKAVWRLSSTLGRLSEEERDRRRRLRELRQEQANTLRAIKKRREARRAGTFKEVGRITNPAVVPYYPVVNRSGLFPLSPPLTQDARIRAKSTPRDVVLIAQKFALPQRF